MDLVERYLAAIARQLPDAQKADVTGELRDVLLSRIEDREAELGRALTGPEVEAQLIDFGHPLTVSGPLPKNPAPHREPKARSCHRKRCRPPQNQG